MSNESECKKLSVSPRALFGSKSRGLSQKSLYLPRCGLSRVELSECSLFARAVSILGVESAVRQGVGEGAGRVEAIGGGGSGVERLADGGLQGCAVHGLARYEK